MEEGGCAALYGWDDQAMDEGLKSRSGGSNPPGAGWPIYTS